MLQPCVWQSLQLHHHWGFWACLWYSEEKFQVVMVVAIKEMTGRKSVKIHWNLNWFSHFGFLLPSTTEKKKFEPDWLVGNQKKRSHAKSNPLHKFHDQIPSGPTFNDLATQPLLLWAVLPPLSQTTQCLLFFWNSLALHSSKQTSKVNQMLLGNSSTAVPKYHLHFEYIHSWISILLT